MSVSLPPVHAMQPLVERLRDTFVEAETPRTHAELLEFVAIAQGVPSWDDLEQFPPEGWLFRRRGAAARWRRDAVVHLDELLYDLRLGSLCLGLAHERSAEGLARIEVSEPWWQRGVLLVGPEGKGALGSAEYYAAQQLAAGGGLLVLDTATASSSAQKLQAVAAAAGRRDFVHVQQGATEPPVISDMAALLAGRGAAYVRLPGCGQGLAAQQTAEAFIGQLLQQAPVCSPGSGRPFMLVVPDGGWVLTPAWFALFKNARAIGVTLVLRLHSLDELDHLTPAFVETVLGLGTQLYLAPNGPVALESAARALELGQGEAELDAVRVQLAELGLGEALLRRTGSRPQAVRLCMLMPYTREQSHQGRMP